LRPWSRSWRGQTEVCRVAPRLVIEGGPIDWNTWVRQIHRWLSIAFTVAVIVNIVALGQGQSAVWIGLLALLPLTLLMLTGLYLFVLPYATKWRRGRHTGGAVLE